jgi:hypothetical protein
MLLDEYVDLYGKDQAYISSVYSSIDTVNLVECGRLLVIGKVQSGKTAHFIGLSLGLFDSGCELGIVFSGTKNNLHDQTLERFRSELKQLDVKVVSDKDDISNSDLINQRLLVVCLKHTQRIKKLLAKLEFFSGRSFLIDDESDQASLNSKNFYNSKRFEGALSSTHEAIRRLEYELNPKYIQITATPACHILTGVLDSFKPDYVLTLQPHSNYFGNKELFENEGAHIIPIVENYRSPNVDNLAYFFITYLYSTYELLRSENCPYNISGFVHPHHTIEVLTNYFEILNKLKNQIESNVHQFISDYSIYLNGRDSNEFVQIVCEILPELDVLLVAGDYDKSINWNDYFQGRRFFILVGGGKLERGFTIEGLITTFLTRSSADGNADTIQQRARFFGSKFSIKGSIRVFMTEKVIEDFKEYWFNERELFKIAEKPIRSNEFKMRFITESTRPCRDAVIFDFNRSFGNSWRHYYISINNDSTEDIFNDLGYSMSIENIGGRDQKILSVDLFDFTEFIKKSVFIGVSDPEFVKLELYSLLTGNVQVYLKMVQLGNTFGFRERKAILRHGAWIPEVVHQGYGSNYIGDSNLTFSDSRLTTQVSFVKLKSLDEKLLVLSIVLGYDKN